MCLSGYTPVIVSVICVLIGNVYFNLLICFNIRNTKYIKSFSSYSCLCNGGLSKQVSSAEKRVRFDV